VAPASASQEELSPDRPDMLLFLDSVVKDGAAERQIDVGDRT
jgi:hypothetical protein